MNTVPVLAKCLEYFISSINLPHSSDRKFTPPEVHCIMLLDSFGPKMLIHGLISTGITEWQDRFYLGQGSPKTESTWGNLLAAKLLTLIHGLWKIFCDITHEVYKNVYTEESRLLWDKTRQQLILGSTNLSLQDKLLKEMTEMDLKMKPIGCIRRWLVDILIARKDMVKSREEYLQRTQCLLSEKISR